MSKTLKPIRLFIGAPPGEQLLAELCRVIDHMKLTPWAGKVRWLDSANIHMTLKFLGSMDPYRVEIMRKDLREHLEFDPFTYQVDCIQLFPSSARPRVIAALVANNDRLNELVSKLEQMTVQYAPPEGRNAFHGHFSLARCSRDFPRDLDFDAIPVDVMGELNGITLYQSDTRSTGAVYTPIDTISCTVKR